jgi:murein L,D-transpeptidase YcbB/YkuD
MPLFSGPPVVPTEISSVYDIYHIEPMWIRNGVETPAVAQLVSILKRAPFDGFADGPQLAAKVEAAMADARSNPASASTAERIMSAAWVSYVKSIRRPTPSMIYSDPSMKPKDARTEEILLTTSAAPSLADYLVKVTNLNPIYTQLRDAAWAEAQATGNMTPDPRFLANLDRTRSIPAKGRFLLVNAGDQRLTLYQDGQVIDR